MTSTEMGAIPNRELTRVDWGQKAKKLLKEVKRITYKLDLEGFDPATWKYRIFIEGSEELKDYMVEKISSQEGYFKILEKLEEDIVREEKNKREEESRKEMLEVISANIRESILRDLNMREPIGRTPRQEIRRGRDCYHCGKFGHMARDCYSRNRDKEENNKKFNSFGVLDFEKKFDRYTLKEKVYNDKGKRIRLNLEKCVKEFPKVFNREEEVEYCGLEKCRIKTQEGKKIIKKGQMVPQSLIRDTEMHLEDLRKRKVIRESNSCWRNPIRAIRKPNGEIRLVSNLMALNDIVEKDEYKLANIRDVIRATQGAELMTVFDLKEAFYSIEISTKQRSNSMEKFLNGIPW